MAEDRDVVIIGAGIAGLVAAHRLRHLSPLVLEAETRPGGRVLSQRRGDLALSVGAHMFPPPESTIGQLVTLLGLEVLPITGSMLNIHLGGRLVRDVRPELMPLRLPLSLAGRASFARAGLRVKRDGARYMKLIEPRLGDSASDIRLRALRYGGDTSFAEFLGPLNPQADVIFRALANRSMAEPEEISRGAMAALFGHVWDVGDLGRNMLGGAGLLPDALAATLGDAIQLGARVNNIRVDNAGVRVRYSGANGSGEVRAQTAIVTVPAPLVPELMPDIPSPASQAIARIKFGSFAVLSVLTDEREPMPWDGLYSILTPEKRFNMFFNHGNALYGTGRPRDGSVLMVYGGGDRARAFSGRTDDDVREAFLADLYELFPQLKGHVAETMVRRWHLAGPFAAPGRWRAQEVLERGVGGRLFFAGDWVSDFVSMETSALTAVDAATRVAGIIGVPSSV